MKNASSRAKRPSEEGASSESLRAERKALLARVRELKDCEAVLRDRLDFLDLIFQGDQLAAYDWNVASGEIAFDGQFECLLGHGPPAHATNVRSWQEFLHPEDRSRVRMTLDDYQAGRLAYLDVEYRARRKNGSWLWVRDRCRAVNLDDQGRPLRARGALRDIDARKRAEAELRESERKYRSVIENIVDVFYRSDAQGRLLMGSPSGAKMFGYESVEEMIGLPLASFWPDPVERDRLLAQVQATGSVQDYEAVLRRKDGSTFHVSFATHFYYDEQGRALGTEGIIRDITERKRAEAERIELERRLLHAQKLESLGILAGGIAHDFNNLLMAILGNIDMSLSYLPADSAARARIEQAALAARRATDLTRQMLAYSGKGRFATAGFDLRELVRENADLFQSAVAKSVSMILKPDVEGCMIEGDPGQIQQVIMNLITNASEAVGEWAGTITLSTKKLMCDDACFAASRLQEKPPAGEYVCLEVADDGCGMDEATIERIFDPFFTTKFRGRGLGLSAVLGIVRAHRGAIMVKSAPGSGTTVRVLFPICRTSLDVEARAPGPPIDASAPKSRSKAILVVDDEPSVRDLSAEYVAQLGFRALSASDGEEALALLRGHEHEIRCILLDLTMPRMDGLSTFRELRRRGFDGKVILCSGYGEEDATRRFALEGLAGFLQKPFLLEHLQTKLAEVGVGS
jgi:two-component system cell cycle sensor histidine kinase/response regulator CckA